MVGNLLKAPKDYFKLLLAAIGVVALVEYSLSSSDVTIPPTMRYNGLGVYQEDGTTFIVNPQTNNTASFDIDLDGRMTVDVPYRDSRLASFACVDSLKALDSYIMWNKNHDSMLKSYNRGLKLKGDTLVPGRYGGVYALTDFDGDGEFDHVQYIGETPGAYTMSVKGDKNFDNILHQILH